MALNAVAQVSIMGLAGALGALLRYLFSRYVAERTWAQIPLLQYPQSGPKKGKSGIWPSNSLQAQKVYTGKPNTSSGFALGTLLINLSGSFVIGLIAGLVGHRLLSPMLQLFLATGFLGGYTTFSTMSWEGVQLARSGSRGVSFFYLGGSLVLGLLAALLGLLVGGWL